MKKIPKVPHACTIKQLSLMNLYICTELRAVCEFLTNAQVSKCTDLLPVSTVYTCKKLQLSAQIYNVYIDIYYLLFH